MAGSESQHSMDSKGQSPAAQPPRKPLQVMHISRKDEQDRLRREAEEATGGRRCRDGTGC